MKGRREISIRSRGEDVEFVEREISMTTTTTTRGGKINRMMRRAKNAAQRKRKGRIKRA